MKQSLLAITTVGLLLGVVVAIALIQSADAATIDASGDIISGDKSWDVTGGDNQIISQEVMMKPPISVVENNCEAGECSGEIKWITGDIIAGTVSVESGDTNTSADGDIEGDPIPGVDVKLGKNPGGLASIE